MFALNMKSAPRKIGLITAVVFVILSVGPAAAGDCIKTSRKYGGASGQMGFFTKIVNRTSKDLNLSIKRCKPGKCDVISKATVSPDKNLDKLTKGGSPSIHVYIGNNNICSYKINRQPDRSIWVPAYNYTQDRVCKSQYQISCEKSYDQGKKRWSTKFVLREK